MAINKLYFEDKAEWVRDLVEAGASRVTKPGIAIFTDDRREELLLARARFVRAIEVLQELIAEVDKELAKH